jgi:hypothetical protein
MSDLTREQIEQSFKDYSLVDRFDAALGGGK